MGPVVAPVTNDSDRLHLGFLPLKVGVAKPLCSVNETVLFCCLHLATFYPCWLLPLGHVCDNFYMNIYNNCFHSLLCHMMSHTRYRPRNPVFLCDVLMTLNDPRWTEVHCPAWEPSSNMWSYKEPHRAARHKLFIIANVESCLSGSEGFLQMTQVNISGSSPWLAFPKLTKGPSLQTPLPS